MGPNGEGRRRPPIGSAHPDEPDRGSPDSSGLGRAPEIRVRPAVEADAAVAGALHAQQISEGFLSLLGTRFLRLLYRRIRVHPTSFLLIADVEGEPVGFIAGSTDVSGLYNSFLWRDGIVAIVLAAGPLARGWRRVLETLRHRSTERADTAGGAELLSVAVAPAWQGQGAGGLLVASFVEAVIARGVDTAHVVVGASNDGAVALYTRVGFVAVDRFELHPGTESLLMQWERPSLPPSSGAD